MKVSISYLTTHWVVDTVHISIVPKLEQVIFDNRSLGHKILTRATKNKLNTKNKQQTERKLKGHIQIREIHEASTLEF